MHDPTNIAALSSHLDGLGRVLLGYSGGVDSALLAVVATRALGQGRFLAVIGRSDSYPEVQHQGALDIAARFGIPYLEVTTRELDDPDYRANNPDRCYFCKRELWSRLAELAAARGFTSIVDGTNADDMAEHRPGLRAAGEREVRSPLAELGWTKLRIRAAAQALGIPVWDAPAAPCLSSRIQYGLTVTPERLRQVEAAEALLRGLGVTGDLRVRHRGELASVEVLPEAQALLERHWNEAERGLHALGFHKVELDPRGYRRGGLLHDLPVLGA